MTKIFHNPRCGKSRQTLALLKEKESDFEIIEYLKTPPTEEQLKSILEQLKMKPLELIRRGESIFKERFKGKELTDDQWIKAMVENPILIERPIVVKNGQAILGRPPENVNQLF